MSYKITQFIDDDNLQAWQLVPWNESPKEHSREVIHSKGFWTCTCKEWLDNSVAIGLGDPSNVNKIECRHIKYLKAHLEGVKSGKPHIAKEISKKNEKDTNRWKSLEI